MAAPFFTALLRNLPTIISVGHGLFNLFTKTMASKKEEDRVIQAFQLLRNHQDNLDRFLEDPERQRILLEGYAILMRRIQENNGGGGGGGAAYRQLPPGPDNFEDNVPRYGHQQIDFREINNGYTGRGKDDFHDVFRDRRDYDRMNDNRTRDHIPWRDDFRGRDDYRGRNGFGDDRRRGGDRSEDYVYRGRNDGDNRPRGDDRDNRTRRDDNLNQKSSKGASSTKGALNKMKEQLVCDVCRCNYDISQHRPTLMPTCGHTFCRACLREESRYRHLLCPVCRSDPFMDVNSLPTNQPLLQLVMEQEGGSNDSSSSSCSPDNTASCNNTQSSCADDTPSCGNTRNSCADDSSCSDSCVDDSLAMLPFEEQIQLVLILSREEMGRIEDDGHNPFAFLDELQTNQGTGLTEAVRRIESNNNSLNDSGCTGITCTDDEDEDLRLAIEMSLQINTVGDIDGTERCTVAQDDISRRDVRRTTEIFAQASAPGLNQIQPNDHFGWDHERRSEREERVNEREELRRREREEMEREKEELRRKKEAFEKEREEWMRSREHEKNRERARNTLAALGCYGEDQEQMNGNRFRDDDNDDCNRSQTKKTNSSSGKNIRGMYNDADCDEDDDDNCCSDDDVCFDKKDDVCCDKKDDCFKNSCSDDDDDVCCDKKGNCFKNICSDDDDVWCNTKDNSSEMCGAAATEPQDLNKTNDNKQDRSAITLNDITFISEEELEKARIRQEKWDRRVKKNEEELQIALALSRSMHEAADMA